jgi:hypothetical protein
MQQSVTVREISPRAFPLSRIHYICTYLHTVLCDGIKNEQT